MLVFPTVHVLVFVFGSALIGITSDYALHYLATGPQTGWAPPAERVKRVARPLAVCALATALGFGSLGLFGVAVFTQVAVFSVAGVLTAWWFTVTILPFMDLKARTPDALTAWWNKLEAPFLKFKWTGLTAVIGAVLVLGVVGMGIARFRVLDDVRQFQPRSAELTAEETIVRNALGFSPSPIFLLSYARSADEARRNEETVLTAWPQQAVRDTLALSRFDPSAARRSENSAALQRGLYEPYLAARVEQLGLTNVDVHAAIEAELPPDLAALEGETNGVHYLVAPLGPRAVEEHATADGVMLVDPAARYTEAFRSFRLIAIGAVGAAFLVCGLIVLGLYRRWRALSVLLAPAFGAVVGIALPTALGMPVSFFTVAALFVVIGTGIDHSVFSFDAAETDGQAKELVVFLAALTTILSMGLLALSGTYPVASLGAVVAAGVTAAYLISFVPARSGENKKSANGQN
jgi:predicted exporter